MASILEIFNTFLVPQMFAEVAQGKSTAVVGMVFMGACIPVVGESIRNRLLPEMFTPDSVVPGGYLPRQPDEFADVVFNDVADPEERRRELAKFVRHSSDSFDGEATYEGWRHIPSTTVIPQTDLILPTAKQEAWYERAVEAGAKMKRAAVEGGHVINHTQPVFVADELVKLAEQESK